MTYSNEQKQSIVAAARQYITNKSLSQNKLAGMANINPSYLSHMLAGNWDEVPAGNKTVQLADRYFTNLATAIGYQVELKYWPHLDTVNYQYCLQTFNEARNTRMPKLIDGDTGFGKSYAALRYMQEQPQETYYIRCAADLTSKGWLLELAEVVGLNIGRATSGSAIRKKVVERLQNNHQPLLIIDESENLKDGAWDSIKTILDDLKGFCGIVTLCAYSDRRLKHRSENAVRNFPQIYRRLKEGGIKRLLPLELDDINEACQATGIKDANVKRLLFDHSRNWGELSGAITNILREANGQPVTMELAKVALDI